MQNAFDILLRMSLFAQLKSTGEHSIAWDVPVARASYQPHVVVLGSGFSGASVAMMLQKHARVTLVDKKTYFENTCSMHRVTTNPEILANNRLLPKEVINILGFFLMLLSLHLVRLSYMERPS
jgi:uncharacterized membrane protein YjjP (DUF1212 family)